MTLELLQKPFWLNKNPVPYMLGGVEKVTDKTEYGEGHFAITIFDRRVFITEGFEYVRNADTGESFVENGEWVGERE